jgi:undecaprenyl phosphate-alpha-L-ara4N flippase subunit ArnE
MIKNRWAILLVLISTLITSSGQIFLKAGASRLNWNVAEQLTNFPLFTGWILYIIGAIMLIIALKYGDLSLLYPIYSLNFVWVSIMSPYFFATDSMNTIKWVGVMIVILGVSCVGVGSAIAMKKEKDKKKKEAAK